MTTRVDVEVAAAGLGVCRDSPSLKHAVIDLDRGLMQDEASIQNNPQSKREFDEKEVQRKKKKERRRSRRNETEKVRRKS